MSGEERDSSRPGLLDEDAQHFEFLSFYRQDEFCDQIIRLEIFEECRTACESETADVITPQGSAAPQTEGQSAEDVSNSRGGRMTRSLKRKWVIMDEVGSSPKKLCGASELQDQWWEEIPVSSVILAAKSRVLRTMFTNGMRESDKSKPVVLKVTPEEKVAFKEMLHFLYAGSLSAAVLDLDASVHHLLDLLIVGDKFEVRSFMGAVLEALSERKPKISDTIALALQVPDVLEQHLEIMELVIGASDLLLETFKDADKWAESQEFLALEEEAVIFLLQSEVLEADSEEDILEGTIAWVCKNRSTLDERRNAMARFSQYIRFGCMRGEYLLEFVLTDPSMALAETQEQVKRGVAFQAYSDDHKADTTDPNFRERVGIQDARLEITCNLKLQEDGSTVESQAASWFGSEWRLRVRQREKTGVESPRVGFYLARSQFADEDTTTKTKFCFYVRTWPDGLWRTLTKSITHDFSGQSSNWGLADALRMSWSEARESTKFVGPTGEISLRVIMRKL